MGDSLSYLDNLLFIYKGVVAYKSLKTKEKSSWVIVVAVAYGSFSLQSLSRSSNGVSQSWS